VTDVRAAVQDLIVRLAHAQDDRDWDVLVGCYEPDATYDHPGGTLVGVDAIAERTQRALTPLDASQHLLGPTLVTIVSATDATAVTQFHAQHVRAAPSAGRFAIGGTYRDRVVARDGVWRIAHRTQRYLWRDDDRRVADEAAIRTLTASYTDALNRADLVDIARVYDEHAAFTMMDRPTVVGREAIVDVLRATLARYQLVMQLVHSGIVHVDGDVARARWQITEVQVPVEGAPRFVAGRYEDEHARRDGQWLFTRRTFTARYLGGLDLSDPVLPDRPAQFSGGPS
jgi:ketosteroid isomerase-like protein